MCVCVCVCAGGGGQGVGYGSSSDLRIILPPYARPTKPGHLQLTLLCAGPKLLDQGQAGPRGTSSQRNCTRKPHSFRSSQV